MGENEDRDGLPDLQRSNNGNFVCGSPVVRKRKREVLFLVNPQFM